MELYVRGKGDKERHLLMPEALVYALDFMK
jgi:hypothetical protein